MSEERVQIRRASMEDLDAIAHVEAVCFPPAEAAGRDSFAERLNVFGSHFLLLEIDGKVCGFINGMVTNSRTIADEMFADAGMHDENGEWQSIFGLDVMPEYRRRGYAAMLMRAFIEEAKKEGRRGLILTCKQALVHYYERFGYVNEGVSASVHGGAQWFDMTLEFDKEVNK